MDPLTALGLASNVIQIVDVSTRIVSKGQSIYKSADGTLAENMDAEAVATDLNLLNTKLQHSLEASKALAKPSKVSLVKMFSDLQTGLRCIEKRSTSTSQCH